MGDIGKNSPRVTAGDPKKYPNWKSARETNTPLKPIHNTAVADFTADPQGKPNEDLKNR